VTTTLPPAPSRAITPLAPNQIATVSTDANSSARVAVVSGPEEQAAGFTSLAASGTATFGPFPSMRFLSVEGLTGQPSVAIADADVSKIEVVGDGSGVREMYGTAAPTDGTTGANIAGPGSRFTNVTNGDAYFQRGTISSPVWKLVSHA
jgi:hypothetical protein